MPHIGEPRAEEQQHGAESSEKLEKIRIKNRRKMYLDRHPSYFTSPSLELADPLLYDRCVRRFQSAAEREADGRAKGYSGVLEADLYRSEAKLAAMRGESETGEQGQSSERSVPFVTYARGKGGEVLPEDPEDVPSSKEEGFDMWKFHMTLRFLKGEDPDFSYQEVDESEEFDVIERKEEEWRWFDDEEPEWATEEDPDLETTGGETGIQDF